VNRVKKKNLKIRAHFHFERYSSFESCAFRANKNDMPLTSPETSTSETLKPEV
jgi:hypothetical protein